MGGLIPFGHDVVGASFSRFDCCDDDHNDPLLFFESANFPHVSVGPRTGAILCPGTPPPPARLSWTPLMTLSSGGVGYFRSGQGYFNTEYIYERTLYPDGAMPFDRGAMSRILVRTNVWPSTPRRGAVDRQRRDLHPRHFGSDDPSLVIPADLYDSMPSKGTSMRTGCLAPMVGCLLTSPCCRKLLIDFPPIRDYVKPSFIPRVSALLRMAYHRFVSVHYGALCALPLQRGPLLLRRLGGAGSRVRVLPNNLWIVLYHERLDATNRASLVQIYRECLRSRRSWARTSCPGSPCRQTATHLRPDGQTLRLDFLRRRQWRWDKYDGTRPEDD